MFRLVAISLFICLLPPLDALSAGAIDAGQRVYRKCKGCHADIDENRAGPSLVSVIGRIAGTAKGFKYSPAVRRAGEDGLVWDKQTLDRYFQNPRSVYGRRHKCLIRGLRKEKDRANLIAFLSNFPTIASANAIAKQVKKENDRRIAKLKAQTQAMEVYLGQLKRAKEALLMGAGPGAFNATGFLRPHLLRLAYHGRFEQLVPADFPAEYYYRFANVVAQICPRSGMDTAQLEYGKNLFELGLDRKFQEDALKQAFEILSEAYKNPGAVLGRVVEKDAALKAGWEDAKRYLKRNLCETENPVSKRMFANIAAILAGKSPVYIDNPKKPVFANE